MFEIQEGKGRMKEGGKKVGTFKAEIQTERKLTCTVCGYKYT